MVIKDILEITSFLTILPVGKIIKHNDLENVSKNMYLFPIIGLIIGLSTIPVIVASFYLFNNIISAFIITIFLIILTGAHHTDALADFADGIMVKGNKEKKYQVVHDPRTGSAGVIAITSYVVGMVAVISSYTGLEKLIISFLISEIISKYSMVLQAFYCESAWPGYSSLFTKNMKSKKKIIISTIITIILIASISHTSLAGLHVFITAIICCYIITAISIKDFGGVSGDVMGATNEIVRLCTLISAL